MKKISHYLIPVILATLTFSPFYPKTPIAIAALAVRPEFNPGILIPDASFSDIQTFGGPEGIQLFLESKNSVLANTSPDFIAKLSEPTDPALKAALDDPQPNLGRQRTAAELIWDASRASGINPQVLLVTLHKEQSLIGEVSANRIDRALRNAMGFACPDASGCGNLFPGFYYQLFGNVDTEGNRYLGAAKSLMKSFNTPGGRGPAINGTPAKVGNLITIFNTLGGFNSILPSQEVIIGNRATAALYRYTPHVFNGNYNFWHFFTSWFKYPNGTVLKSISDGLTYIINDGNLQLVPNFVALARKLDMNTVIAASPTELADYPRGTTYGPADDTIVVVDNVTYVFEKGVKHKASDFVLRQRKLDPTAKLTISTTEAALFPDGTQLTPRNGTILRAQGAGITYLVENGILKQYSDFTLAQYDAAKLAEEIPVEEIALYTKDGFVAPKNNTLIKGPSTNSVYVMSESRRLPLTEELFRSHGYRFKDVVTLTTDAEIASIPLGPPATPKENTYFTIGSEFFVFKNGSKHPIFPFVAKQRFMTPDYRFEASIAIGWPDGIAIAPKDGTLLRSVSDPAVYVVKNGQLRTLTGTLFTLLRYSFKNVITAPDTEIAALAKGGFAEPPANTYFSVDGTGEFYVYKSDGLHRIYPFVAKQRFMTPDYTFAGEVIADWTIADPIAPRNGTLIKSDAAATVYLVSSGVLRPLSDTAFKARGYSIKKVITIPEADLNGFEKGDLITK